MKDAKTNQRRSTAHWVAWSMAFGILVAPQSLFSHRWIAALILFISVPLFAYSIWTLIVPESRRRAQQESDHG
ncbi:hypothetical protein R77567_01646 [Ralstonia sp. LMG 32965]|uniref:Transmembrane protein n=1 Tax=Ralstonia flatus TaxID=3058601 RepID=A0AAD2BW95_9RALS|nr:hypothetical protein R77567_01646 [Ralstonia sp. LMG 32965]